jgi:hypothetical protein
VDQGSRQTVPGAASADEASIDADVHEAMGYFLREWIKFEVFVREAAQRRGTVDGRVFVPTGRGLERLGLLSSQARNEIERIRRMRNNLVHGIGIPNPADMREAAARLHDIVETLEGGARAV